MISKKVIMMIEMIMTTNTQMDNSLKLQVLTFLLQSYRTLPIWRQLYVMNRRARPLR